MPKKIRFIDCGANVGKAIDWAAKKYKDDLVRIDAFEPEYHNYTALLDKYLQDPELSQVLVIHTQAVWTQNTIKDFYIQAWGTRTGSSLLEEKEQAFKEGQYVPMAYRDCMINLVDNPHFTTNPEDGGYYVNEDCALNSGNRIAFPVQCINLSDWIIKNLNKKEYNILKIDVEGAEYDLIDHLLKTKAHEYIDEWLVEFTPKSKVPQNFSQEIIDKFKSTVTKYVDWGDF